MKYVKEILTDFSKEALKSFDRRKPHWIQFKSRSIINFRASEREKGLKNSVFDDALAYGYGEFTLLDPVETHARNICVNSNPNGPEYRPVKGWWWEQYENGCVRQYCGEGKIPRRIIQFGLGKFPNLSEIAAEKESFFC